jgi:hypothetical protein
VLQKPLQRTPDGAPLGQNQADPIFGEAGLEYTSQEQFSHLAWLSPAQICIFFDDQLTKQASGSPPRLDR